LGPARRRATACLPRAPRIVRSLLAVDARAAVWAAGLGFAFVILIGAFFSAVLNIWIDEAFTLHTTGAGPLAAWAGTIDFEAQPPVYFVLEALWRTLNEASIAFARLPSVLFAGVAVAVIVGAAHRIIPTVPPAIIAVVTALNPLIIWTASEMRVYALMLLIGATLTWSFFEGFLVERPSRRARIVYAVVALVGLYTQYYIGFALAAHFITLLLVRRTGIRAFVGLMAIVAAAFAPFVPIALRHVETGGSFVTRVTFIHAAHEVLNATFVDVLPHELEWTGPVKIGGFAVAIALLIGLAAFGRPALRDNPSRAIVLTWLINLVLFMLLFAASGSPLDPARHLIVIAPLSLLVALLFIASLTRGRSGAACIALGVFAVFALTSLWTEYRPPLAKKGDWKRVAQLLSTAESSAPIAIFPAELALPLAVYLPRPTVPIPRPMPFSVDYVRVTTLKDEADVSRVLDPVYAHSPQLWMVTSGTCSKVNLVYYEYNCSVLEGYLDRRYRLLKTVSFRGSLARLFVRTSGPRSERPLNQDAN
jgi:uncharacterized membrane protein